MDQYVTGAIIKQLRERNHMTQTELAEKLTVSDKTVSKWETGRGYPDISLLEPLSAALHVSVTELLSGCTAGNANVSGNMARSKFCVCPLCGNIFHSMGEAVISCHGIRLMPLEAEEADERHTVSVEMVEDEYFVTVHHEMTRRHYISFIAALTSDRLQLVKLYPEGNAETRLKMNGVRDVYFYCNRDGLFRKRVR